MQTNCVRGEKNGPPGCFSRLTISRIENKGTCKEAQTQMRGYQRPPNQPKMFSFFSGVGWLWKSAETNSLLTSLSSTCGDSSDCSAIIREAGGKYQMISDFWHLSPPLTGTWRSKLSSSAGNSALDTSRLLSPCGNFHSRTWKTWIETPKAV